jgi:FtsP/CotA-like multicopper oxidase with cupredoxin domain
MIARRRFLAGAAATSLPLLGARAQDAKAKPDYLVVLWPMTLEIAPGTVVKTIGYNNKVPGPTIRLSEGQQATIEVSNMSGSPDIVHWHGLKIPSPVDGAMEEGATMIAPGETRSYGFTAAPAGTRWYHSHAYAGQDLTRSLYSGQYGFFIIEPKSDPGRYDQEVLIAMHHWEPHYVSLQDIRQGPPPDNGLEVMYKSASFNDRALGHGEPVRVRQGQRVLFRLLNASATKDAAVALSGHRFTVLALDGNPVPQPQTLDSLYLAPGERIDAVVEMTEPGVWVFGSTDDDERRSGLGVVVEYAGAAGAPQWRAPPKVPWDYVQFGRAAELAEPDGRIELVFQKIAGGRGGFNRWTINGKSWPDSDPLLVRAGKRYRLVMHNLSGDLHPIHLHRHTFELTNFMGRATAGVMKDTVAVPGRRSAEVDLVADDPGDSLFHCHMQDHQDFGFMALMKYAG